MAQAAKKVRRLAGDDYQTKVGIGVPPNVADLAVAVKQLQDTVNEVITRFNAHTHGGVTVGAGTSGAPNSTLVTGAAVAATNLFVNADS